MIIIKLIPLHNFIIHILEKNISFNTQICYIGAWYYAVFQFICAVPHQRLSARPSVLGVFEDDEAGQIARCADAKAGSYIN